MPAAALAREMITIRVMVGMYCHVQAQHGGGSELCNECAALWEYAQRRVEKCPFGAEKPTCANSARSTATNPTMRERVRSVMRYAGPRMLLRPPRAGDPSSLRREARTICAPVISLRSCDRIRVEERFGPPPFALTPGKREGILLQEVSDEGFETSLHGGVQGGSGSSGSDEWEAGGSDISRAWHQRADAVSVAASGDVV